MIKVVLLGAGKVARHLFDVFKNSDLVIVNQVYNHHPEKLIQFKNDTAVTTDSTKIKNDADIYIISVNDDAISTVASKLSVKKGLIVHTAGAVAINVLANHDNFGVFYPLQSFSAEKAVNFKEIPICIEANSEENLFKIKNLACSVSNLVYEISSEQRRILHVAAVFANNFSNHMFTVANAICKKNKIPFEILKPLIAETFEKINTLPPEQAQTGPAVRNDTATMQQHISYLNSDQQKIYATLSESILKNHGKKL